MQMFELYAFYVWVEVYSRVPVTGDFEPDIGVSISIGTFPCDTVEREANRQRSRGIACGRT